MIADARTIPDGTVLETEVCIVGAGPAGITLARELRGHGVDVCILESGGLGPEPETGAFNEGDNAGIPYRPLHEVRTRAFGGSSTLWKVHLGPGSPWVRLRPLDPADLEERPWVPHSGWPFGMGELRPYLRRAEGIFGLAAHISPAAWSANDPSPLGTGEFEEILFRFGPSSVFTEVHREELDLAERVLLYVHGTVIRLETDERGERVTQVLVATLAGTFFHVAARAFVLAAGGIENARLLLLSEGASGRGLGNEHDLVGRFFMEHLHTRTGIVVPANTKALARFPHDDIVLMEGAAVERRLALRPSVARDEGLLHAVVGLTPTRSTKHLRSIMVRRPPSAAVSSLKALRVGLLAGRRPEQVREHLGNALGAAKELGLAAGARLPWRVGERVRRLRRRESDDEVLLGIDVMSEQAPNPDSRVTLSDKTDPLGLPRARLIWQLTPLDFRTLAGAQRLVEEAVRRCGLGRGYSSLKERLPRDLHGGPHHMGTTRIHPDPRYGVVDVNCRVHGIENLYVAGSSVFPTGGFANPTLTLIALALRLGERIVQDLGPAGLLKAPDEAPAVRSPSAKINAKFVDCEEA
jgi:choline dehydrogenase-like flavoprotein